jgi:hypothetical protein
MAESGTVWEPGKRMIKRKLLRVVGIGAGLLGPMALAFSVNTAFVGAASAQQMPASASPCDQFRPLSEVARQRGEALGAAQKHHPDRKEMCTLVSQFSVAEAAVVKFLETNQSWCGVPAEVVKSAKTTHEKTMKFKEMVCAPAPQPKIPTLSDAIGTPKLDTSKNTKTGHGTLDTLTGNPLAQ